MDIAKRIERGQRSALKALSRSPLVIRQILLLGEDLKRGIRSITSISEEESRTRMSMLFRYDRHLGIDDGDRRFAGALQGTQIEKSNEMAGSGKLRP